MTSSLDFPPLEVRLGKVDTKRWFKITKWRCQNGNVTVWEVHKGIQAGGSKACD
jgi:hypothetical protein